MAAGWTKIETFTAKRTKIVVSAFRIRTADSCYTIQIISAGKKMITHIHYVTWSVEYNLLGMHPIKVKFSVFVGILFFIDITEIGKVFLENNMKNIPASGKKALRF